MRYVIVPEVAILVDECDLDLLDGFTWSLGVAGGQCRYAERYERGKTIRLHRLIGERIHGGPINGLSVDHINGDTLDDRRGNLRVVSHQANICNRGPDRRNVSGYVGVTPRYGRWRACLAIPHPERPGRQKQIALGVYDTIAEAVQARLEGEVRFWGEKLSRDAPRGS